MEDRLSNEIQDNFWVFLNTGGFGVFIVVFHVTSLEKFSKLTVQNFKAKIF